MSAPVLLVVAKAPVPGLAKTRLAAHVGDAAAADLAACALLDTLDAARAVGSPVVVAMTGDLGAAARADEVRAALATTTVVEQRGTSFGERLVHAHADAVRDRPTSSVVQVGMDTPQLTADDLRAASDYVAQGRTVLAPASDGGWWLLGLPDAAVAAVLGDVPMSRDDTGELTRRALGGTPEPLRELRDVDEWPDALAVAASAHGTRFAAAVRQVQEVSA